MTERKCDSVTGFLECNECIVILTAVLLVRLVVTVVDLVTPPVGGDAVGLVELVVSTGELARLAVWGRWNEAVDKL